MGKGQILVTKKPCRIMRLGRATRIFKRTNDYAIDWNATWRRRFRTLPNRNPKKDTHLYARILRDEQNESSRKAK